MKKRILSVLLVLAMVTMIIPVNAVNMEAQQAESAPMGAAASAAVTSGDGIQTVELGIPVEENPELFLTRSMPTHGEGKIAVFLIDFPDYRNENAMATAEYYDDLYFGDGVKTSSWSDPMTVAGFYKEQSYGKLELSGQVFDWYTAEHERSYYDNRKAELVLEAAEYYRAQGVDFSQFDGDSDGVIDSIVYHFAGEYSTNKEDPWYSGVAYGESSVEFGEISGLKFTTMVQVKEGASADSSPIVIVCHELMHTLGMLDLYGEVSYGLMPTDDLMSTNDLMINPYTKMMLGWIDTVKVITGDVDDVSLGVCEDTGDAAIVTDAYNGLFDEFYLVAYRRYSNFEQSTTAVVWHIDARLTENGNSFLCSNQTYDPRPDKDNPHRGQTVSPYLFIEELSAYPGHDSVQNLIGVTPEEKAFAENSVLGPDNMPSSDTHDGRFTGIRMDSFLEYNDTYVTFDVSFVEDTAAPVVTTDPEDLEFKETVTVAFNEHIYQGENWDSIQVTDLEGVPLDATILRPHYPCNVLEITFADEAYRDGYKLTLPEGCVRDSSGNALEAVSLVALEGNYLFPLSQTQLPGTGEYPRCNAPSDGWFFPVEESLVVITPLWENLVTDAKVEFMRLDYAGNVLTQNIVDNPFDGSEIRYVGKTEDGCYIIFCSEESQWQYCNLLFCLDANGNLKWINDDFHGTDHHFNVWSSCKYGAGLAISHQQGSSLSSTLRFDTVLISSESGEVQQLEGFLDFGRQILELSNGKLLRHSYTYHTGEEQSVLDIINPETFETEKTLNLGKSYYSIEAESNGNGTMTLWCSDLENREAILLDADWNVVKSVILGPESSEEDVIFLGNDGGFCVTERTVIGNHDHNQFHIRRYDRYFNLIWESDVVANFIYYFQSPDGEILAYKSMLEPERECYIEYYGSEDAYKTEHLHRMICMEAIAATCLSEGQIGYWYCSDCGCRYADPAGADLLVEIDKVPKTDHSFTNYVSDENATTEADGTKTAYCDYGCGKSHTVTDEGSKLTITTITSDVYTVSGDFISKIGVGTKAETLLGNLGEGRYASIYLGNTAVAKSAPVGTGMVVKIMDGSTEKVSATIVVTGDINGDSKITISDMLAAKAHLLKKSALNGAYSKAADTNGDGIISITDFIQLKAHILGMSKVEPKSVIVSASL